jgi:hypothetical protein
MTFEVVAPAGFPKGSFGKRLLFVYHEAAVTQQRNQLIIEIGLYTNIVSVYGEEFRS